jgi:hypothetical protein
VVAAHPVEHTPERFGHHGLRADRRQRVCARLQEWIGGQAGLRASRAEVVFTHGWTTHRALPIHGEPNMQDGRDMNHRFLALTFVTEHTLRYLAERWRSAVASRDAASSSVVIGVKTRVQL